MATFLKLEDPANALAFIVLNVMEFHEEPLLWQGGEDRAFDNTLLSTQRDPRREWGLTVEFDTATALENFRIFCSTLTDFQTGRPTALRPLRMRSDVSPSGAIANGGPITVKPAFGRIEPSVEEVVGGVIRQRWKMDLRLREI